MPNSSQSDSAAFPLFLDTYATRLLAEPLRSSCSYGGCRNPTRRTSPTSTRDLVRTRTTPDVAEGETADLHGNEHGHREHAEEIDYPLTPVMPNTAGEGSSTTVLEGFALDELFAHGPKYLNVHAAGSGDPPQLACVDVGEASQRTNP